DGVLSDQRVGLTQGNLGLGSGSVRMLCDAQERRDAVHDLLGSSGVRHGWVPSRLESIEGVYGVGGNLAITSDPASQANNPPWVVISVRRRITSVESASRCLARKFAAPPSL